MFEQDYVMRLIKEMVRAILKLLFNIDTHSPSENLLKDTDQSNLEIALLFYFYLNDKTDKFLEEHNFNRDEIKSGLLDITAKYGIDGYAEMFL